MKPSPFGKMNNVLDKPKDMSNCGRLPIYKDITNNQLFSLWVGSFFDRLRFLISGKLWLIVKGSQQPPISMTTKYPWEK